MTSDDRKHIAVMFRRLLSLMDGHSHDENSLGGVDTYLDQGDRGELENKISAFEGLNGPEGTS